MDDKTFNALKIFGGILIALLLVIIVMGYFLFKKDNSGAISELKQQNIQLSKQIDSISHSINTKVDSIKVLKEKSIHTQTIYQRDVYHVWSVEDKDSVAAIIRQQMYLLKNPKID